jgi:hypothetical protein
MGNWVKQIEIAKEHKEKDKVRKEKLAGYFFDLSININCISRTLCTMVS